MSQTTLFLLDHNRRIGEIADVIDNADLYTFSKMLKCYLDDSPKKFGELNARYAGFGRQSSDDALVR